MEKANPTLVLRDSTPSTATDPLPRAGQVTRRKGRWHLVADYSNTPMSPTASPEGLIVGGDVVWARCPSVAYAEVIFDALVAADDDGLSGTAVTADTPQPADDAIGPDGGAKQRDLI